MDEQELRAKALEIAAVIGGKLLDHEDATEVVLNRYYAVARKIEQYIREGQDAQSR